MKPRLFFVLLCIFLLFAAPAGAADKVTAPGSGTNYLVLGAIAKAFMTKHPGVTVEVPPSSGTSGGYRTVGEGEADIARVARPPKTGKEQEYGLEYLPMGTTTISFASHPGVKVANLTGQQSADIFSGKITNWKEVGGPDLKIRVIRRYEKEQHNMILYGAIPEWKGMVFTPQSKEGPTDQETIDLIAQHEGAIGYGGVADCRAGGLNLISLNGVSALDVKAHPAKIDVGIAYKKERLTGAVKEFVDFIFSPESAAIMKEYAMIQIPR